MIVLVLSDLELLSRFLLELLQHLLLLADLGDELVLLLDLLVQAPDLVILGSSILLSLVGEIRNPLGSCFLFVPTIGYLRISNSLTVFQGT